MTLADFWEIYKADMEKRLRKTTMKQKEYVMNDKVLPYFGDYNIVMSHIRNIREKIEDNPSKPIYIQTVWGVGYRFNKNGR